MQLPDANVLKMLSGVAGSARDVCRLLQDIVLAKNAGNVAPNVATAVPPSPAVPPASLTVTVIPPKQQVTPSAQPTP